VNKIIHQRISILPLLKKGIFQTWAVEIIFLWDRISLSPSLCVASNEHKKGRPPPRNVDFRAREKRQFADMILDVVPIGTLTIV